MVMSFGCVVFIVQVLGRRAWACAGARGGRDVNRGQDAEDVGLHHAGEQAEHVMTIGKMKGVIVSRMR
jgi:hypothetical protein